MDCTRTITQCLHFTRVFQTRVPHPLFGIPPVSGVGWEILMGGFNLHDGGNLRRSDFGDLNLFHGQKQHSVNIES